MYGVCVCMCVQNCACVFTYIMHAYESKSRVHLDAQIGVRICITVKVLLTRISMLR